MKPRGNRRRIFLTLLFFFLLFGLVANAWGQTISLVGTSGLTVTVQVTCPGGCSGISIDWGDGSPWTGPLPPSSPVTRSHTYGSNGTYCIQLICLGEPCNSCSIETGCSSDSCLQVTLLPPVDVTPPIITITSPTSSPTYTTSSPVITLGGTASDNVGVTQVTWANNRGGSGTAAGTTSWNIAGITLQSGSNVITVTAHDAAGNTGTDAITVTYTPPGGGAFSVTPSPSSSGVVPGQQNVIPVIYTASAPGGASFTATSSQGRFVTASGSQLGTVNQTVIIRLRNGNGMAPESVIMPASVIAMALRQKQNRIYYERTFTHGSDTATTRVALQVVPASAGPFSLVKMELVFVERTPRYGAGGIVRQGRATVPRNSTSLKAAAHITYNGSGLLLAQWKVDGQVLGYVSQYLYAGTRDATIESPEVPGLPTYDTGRHSVELEIIQPAPPFQEPVIYYYVTQEFGAGTPQTLQLISPDDHATVPLSMPGGTGPEFQWESLAGAGLYHFELYPAHAAAPHGATLPFGGGTSSGSPAPVISADTPQGSYTLSQGDLDNLQPGVEYTWHVQAFQGNELVAASVFWTVTFEAAQAQGGGPYFEFLHITPVFQENQGHQNWSPAEPQSRWFHFGPRNAYAIEVGPGGVHLPDSMEVIIPGQGQSTTTMQVTEGQEVSIVAGLKNPGTQEKQNIRVEFLVDGQTADVSFIPALAPGQLVTVQTTYEVPDAYSHTVEVKATEGEGAEAATLASINGYLENTEGEQTQLPTEPPAEGYWIGAFNLKPTSVTNGDLNNYTGSGTIEIPFMSEYPVEFSGLQINEAEKRVTGGQIMLELGGFDLEIGAVTVHLDAIVFMPDKATCEGHAGIQLVSSSNILELGLADIIVLPEGLSGKLQLAGQTSISLVEPMGFGLTVDPSSYIRLSRNQLMGSSLDGNLQVPDQFLALLSGAAGIQFSGFSITSDGGFYGQATLPSTRIGNTNISVSGTVVLDLTNTTSPTGLPAGFKGVYLQSGKLTFPSEVSLPDLNISGFYVDGTGVNGRISLSNLGLDLDVGGFSGGLSSITLGFDHNALTEGALVGNIHVPFIETDFDFNLMITANGVEALDLALAQDKTVSIDALYLNLTVARGSSIGVEQGVGKAHLNGSIGTLQGAPIPISGTDFQGLIIDALGNVDLSGGWINLGNLDTDFHGFPFTLTAVGLGKEGSKYFFGLEGGLDICPGKFALAGDTRIKVLATKSGDSLSYDSIQVDKISVELGVPHAFSFTGEVDWYENDPDYGRGFKGAMTLSAADLISADATLMVGNTGGYFYFFIHGDVAFPGGGMPLSPLPLSIYGFNGGAYYNVAPPDPDIGETRYLPAEGQYGLMAGIDVGTYDGGYTFNAKLGLEITVSPFSLTMTGDGWVLTGITERSSKPGIETKIELAFDPFVLTASLGVRMNYHGIVTIPASGNGTEEADLKFSEDDWYINIGTKESPISINALQIFTCSGYFDIGNQGIAMGFAQSLHAGGRWWIFYGYLDTGLKADVAVGYNPFFIYGEVSAWFDVRAGIHVDIWFWEGDIDIINAGVSANLGVRAPNPTRLWGSLSAHFSVLGGIVHGSFSMSFSWSTGSEGEVAGAGGEELQLPPAIVYTYPQEGSTDIPLAAKFFGKFPFRAGEIRTAPTSEGDMDYRVRFGSIYLLYTSADGRTLAVTERAKGVSADGMECYFYPKYLLVPNREYRLRIEAFMEKKPHGGDEWQLDGSHIFWSHFATGAMVTRWNQYVASTYPRTGQKWVYTKSDVDINFMAGMPSGYRAKTYKKSGGGWEEGNWYDLDWINNRRTIHCERFGPNTPEKWLPNTMYEIRVISPSGDVVYKLPFKTSAYENFAQMMHASSLNPRVGWGMDDVPPYLFHVITFDTVEPINWRDVEQVVVRPTHHWTGTPEVEHKIGYSEITVQRPVQILAHAAGSTFSLPLTGPVKISSIINIDGTHYKSWDTRNTIRHYIDYTNLFFTPDLQSIRDILPAFYTVVAAYVRTNTLSLEEKQALWNGLQVAVPTSYQVKLVYRSIDQTPDPLSWRESILQLEIPEDKLNRW